jgi:hypothetical protein
MVGWVSDLLALNPQTEARVGSVAEIMGSTPDYIV